MVIYPEGFTSNNTHLLPFKKGAFASLQPVQPWPVVYGGFPGVPVMACLTINQNGTMAVLANLVQWQTRFLVPPFLPNAYFFETHKDKGEEKSHVYAWAVRDIMRKVSGLKLEDNLTML